MSLNVIFFANLKEELGCDSLTVESGQVCDVPGLINHLASTHDESWRALLTAENILVAVNQTLITDDLSIADGDEVAFFPPVTGG